MPVLTLNEGIIWEISQSFSTIEILKYRPEIFFDYMIMSRSYPRHETSTISAHNYKKFLIVKIRVFIKKNRAKAQ